ncbi:hypothetical protein ACLOJK_002392 [Asimina triloba]
MVAGAESKRVDDEHLEMELGHSSAPSLSLHEEILGTPSVGDQNMRSTLHAETSAAINQGTEATGLDVEVVDPAPKALARRGTRAIESPYEVGMKRHKT